MTIDTLAEKNVDELDLIYRNGILPSSFKALDGMPKGRMLSIKYIDKTPLSFFIKYFAGSGLFPWEGKSFKSNNNIEGSGINRIQIMNTLKFNWFPFKTKIVPSIIDGRDCILLDYDLPENPWFIRKIRDELRKVSNHLFLGPAMWKNNKGGADLVLWFAISG
ncbi:MAG: hypothetical protein HQK78_14800 [Desulfobacterales bacterium]|nr:hypothetical protein [Desulfobacterales bacterium]